MLTFGVVLLVNLDVDDVVDFSDFLWLKDEFKVEKPFLESMKKRSF
jgi:hypothetical protein